MPARGIASRVRRAILVLLAALPGLSGCAGPAVEEQANWQCERTPDGRSWSCVQRRPGDGVAAGAVATAEPGTETPDTVAADTGAGDAKATGSGLGESAPAAQAVPAPEPTPKTSWSRRLPGLQESQPQLESLSVVPELAVGSRTGPPPEPEPALARWEGADVERSVGEEAAASSPATTAVGASKPQAPTVSPEVRTPPPRAGRAASSMDSAAPGGGKSVAVAESPGADIGPRATPRQGPYTVQIGAFRSDADASAYLEQHRLDDLEVVLEHRASQGREYSVLTFGHFATVREATAAWRRVAAGRELDFWVRPAR